VLEMIQDLGRIHQTILAKPECRSANAEYKSSTTKGTKVHEGKHSASSSNSEFLLLASAFLYFLFCDTDVMDYTPQRVVSLQPSATVTLRDLGKVSSLVACTKYCLDVCPDLERTQVAIVADSWTAQAAQISELKSDLVIASVPYQEKALAEIMKCGARFLGLAPKSLADIYADIAVIAGIMGAPEEGSEMIRRIQAEIDTVRSRTKGLPRPRVFCEEWGKPLIASQHWVAELVEAAGGEFIGTPGAQISFADVAAEKPDVIIAAWCGAGDRVPLEKIIRERKWESTSAAKSGRVYCIRDEYLNTPAPTLVCGLHSLAAAIHPERFSPADGVRRINN
jgi:iron complex transport system substrate-binding protein